MEIYRRHTSKNGT